MTAITYAIGYARVSTAKQAVEGDSLPIQATVIAGEIQHQGWTIHPASGEVIQEPFTGTTDDRLEYRRAIQIIRDHPGEVKYFVVRTIDRFSREGSTQYLAMKAELATLGVELRDTYHVIQPTINTLAHTGFEYDWSKFSPSRKAEIAEAEAGKQEINVMLTRMIGQEILLVQQGYHIGNADDGYVIVRLPVEEKKKCVLKPDPDRAHFFRVMFEMRAAGTHSDEDIVAHVNSLGFKTKTRNQWDPGKTKIIGRTTPKPLTVKRFQALIRTPAYCGVILEKWTHNQPVRARGEGIVSIDLYNRANRGLRYLKEQPDGTLRMLYDHSPDLIIPKRHSFDERWRYKNIVVCPTCRRPLWASASRGRSGQKFAFYHCARNHPRYAVRQKVLDVAFHAYLASVRTIDARWTTFIDVVKAEYGRHTAKGHESATHCADLVRKLSVRKDQLIEAFACATSDSVRKSLEEKVHSLDAEIAATIDTSLDLSVNEDALTDFLDHVRKLLEHPAQVLDFIRNKAEQVALYRLFFEEFPTYQEIESGTAKLTPTFRVFWSSDYLRSDLVDNNVLNWNTLHQEMKRWEESYWAIDVVYERMQRESQVHTDEKKAA